jgi:hypothetical protein
MNFARHRKRGPTQLDLVFFGFIYVLLDTPKQLSVVTLGITRIVTAALEYPELSRAIIVKLKDAEVIRRYECARLDPFRDGIHWILLEHNWR